MKPVNPEDRKKLMLLMAGVVVAFGFIGKTVLGIIGSKNAAAAQSQPAPAPAPAPVAAAPTPGTPAPTTGTPAVKPTLTSLDSIEMGGPTNPFRKVLPDPASFNAPPGPANIPPPSGSGLKGAFPPPGGPGKGVPPVNPGAAGVTMPLEPPLKLEGVVASRENYAMVTVSGKTEMYRAGNKIARMFEVISIDEYGASFRGPGGVFRLEVGQEHTPSPAPAAPSPVIPSGMLPALRGG